MKKLLITSAVALGLMSSAAAAQDRTTKGGEIVCVTSELFDELQVAHINNNSARFNYLMNDGSCFQMRPGVNYRVVKVGIIKPTHIRAYDVDGRAFDLYTSNNNIGGH